MLWGYLHLMCRNNALTDWEVAQWHQRRERRMLACQRAKYTQHPALGAALMATHPHPLRAHAWGKALANIMDRPPGSSFWYADRRGRNTLGVILERIRNDLLGEQQLHRRAHGPKPLRMPRISNARVQGSFVASAGATLVCIASCLPLCFVATLTWCYLVMCTAP